MKGPHGTEDHAAVNVDSLETDPLQPPRRSRRLPLLPMAAGAVALGCVFVVVAVVLWRRDTALPDGVGNSEGVDAPARFQPATAQAASAVQPEMAALRKEALDVAGQLVKQFPEGFDAICVLGLVHNRFGNRVEAEKCWKRCLRLDPEFVSAHYCLGRNALDHGKYEETVKWAGRALQIDPEMSDAHLLLAQALMGLGRMPEAIAALEEHVRLSPGSTEGYFRLAEAYLYTKQYEKAKQYYKVTLEIDPAWSMAYYGLTMASARLGQTEEAKKYQETFEKRKAHDHRVQGARERARDDLAVLRWSVADAYSAAAKVYFAHGSTKEAEKHWRRAAELNPKDTESREALVSAFQQQGRFKQALPILGELTELEPENLVHYINLGVLNMQLEQFEAAEKAFSKVKELAPEHPKGYVALVQLYLKMDGKLPEAKTLAGTAVRLEPIASNYFLLGTACRKTGDREGALTATKRAVELDPGNALYREVYLEIQETIRQEPKDEEK